MSTPATPTERSPANDRSVELAAMQQRIAEGEYNPCPRRVATAILQRIGEGICADQALTEIAGGRALIRSLSAPREA